MAEEKKTGTFKKGYAAVKEAAASQGVQLRLKDGDEVRVRFIDEEPTCFYQHAVPVGKSWRTATCLSEIAKECPICASGNKKRFVGAYNVYDYKAKRVRIFVQGIRALKILEKLSQRPKGLTGQDFDISRMGEGTDSTYQFLPQKVAPFAFAKSIKRWDLAKAFAPKSPAELKKILQDTPEEETSQEVGEPEDTGSKVNF